MSTRPTYPDVVSPPGQEIGLNAQAASPPIAAYVGKDDALFIMTSLTAGSPLVTVAARLLMPNGDIVPNIWSFTPPVQRAGFYTNITLPECFILSLAITVVLTGSARPLFAEALLFRGITGSSGASQVLCTGYLTPSVPLSWPSGFNTDNVNCVGSIRSITGSTPAAGANLSETVPNNARWRPIAMNFTLTASATVANRGLVVVLDDGVNIFSTGANANALTASQVGTVNVCTSPELNSSGLFIFPINLFAGVILSAGFRIRSAIQNLQAADQISGIQYLVEEWLVP